MKQITKTQALTEYYSDQGWDTQPVTVTYIRSGNIGSWTPNSGELDQWNCISLIWEPAKDKLLLEATATTKPGLAPVHNPVNPDGTFQILSGCLFEDCWELGYHTTQHSHQRALVQCDDIKGHRYHTNGQLGTAIYTGNFGVNQHTTGNSPDTDPPYVVGYWSEGCLVRKYAPTHFNKFIPILEDSGQATFDTAIILAKDMQDWLSSNGYVLNA